jgi:hypothetical protein
MDGIWFHCFSEAVTLGGFSFDTLTKTFPKEQFNVVSRYVDQRTSFKSKFEMLSRP